LEAESHSRSSTSAGEALVAYLARHPEFRATPADVRGETQFVDMRMRFSLAVMTGGMTMGTRTFNRSDPQTKKAIQLIPAARALYERARALSPIRK